MPARLMARFLTCLSVVLVTATSACAWEAPYVEEGIGRCIKVARALKDMSGFGARSDGVCLIGGFMETEGEITWKCKLKGGKEYIFVASGDTDVKDLDLAAELEGKVIAKDTAEDNTPIVAVTVHDDCDVTMKMHLAAAPGEGQKHFCVMIMLESEGTGGRLSQLEGVAKQLNEVCAKVTDKGDLQFDQASNTVCIVAGLLESGTDKSFSRNFSGGTNYVVVGAGDDACKDLDLEVLQDGTSLAKDDSKDSTPVITLKVNADVRCTFKMIMHESEKPSFSVVGILSTK